MSRKKSFEEKKSNKKKTRLEVSQLQAQLNYYSLMIIFLGKQRLGGQQFLFVLRGGGGEGGLLFKSAWGLPELISPLQRVN